MKNKVIGIDISKDNLDFCQLEPTTMNVTGRGATPNQRSAIEKWIKCFDRYTVFALEHTGHYGALLIECINEHGFDLYLINPLELKKSLGIHRGKTDAKDAYRIAEYAIVNQHKLKYHQLPSRSLKKLKALLTARERYVKISVQLQNAVKANEILDKSIDVKFLVSEERKLHQAIIKSIRKVETEIKKVVAQNIELKTTYEKITKVVGIGPIIATKCIVETANFSKFDNARKFSCHCGLAPFEYKSGTSIRGKTKTHYLRDKSLKAILTKGAVTAIQHDIQLKKYYNRKMAEGKHHMSVINAVANKLVLRIFAVAKRKEPFVKLSH